MVILKGYKHHNFLTFLCNLYLIAIFANVKNEALVAELVDALDSKSSDSNIVRVRFPPKVLKPDINVGFFV